MLNTDIERSKDKSCLSALIRKLGVRSSCFATISLMLLCASMVVAQSVTSGLLGAVTDQNGAIVPGATVTLVEPSTGSTKTSITDSNGSYSFQELKPGTYQVKITKDGFSSYVADNVLVENLQVRRVDAALKVGETAEIVTINAGAALITTEGGTITSTITKARVADNPSVDTYPNPYDLFKTLPGVQGNGWDIKVVGQNSAQQTIGLDGVINDRHGEQNNNINFYEEANLTTVNATADNARVVNYNLVSKRGQNKFHGMAYYKRFDDSLNARDSFDLLGKPSQLQHEAQFEGSGPIWKNKTFFYASWFLHRVPSALERTGWVPSAAWRGGDFSNLLGLANPIFLKDPFAPAGSTCAPTAPTPDISGCLRDASRATASNPNGLNIIPTARLHPVALRFQSYLPQANGIDANNPINNADPNRRRARPAHVWTHPFPSDYFKAGFPFIRIDHQFNDKNSIYGKWTRRKTPYVLTGGLPGFHWTRLRDHSQFSVTDTHVFRPNLINSFAFGLSKDFIEDGTETSKGYPMYDGNQVISDTGIQGMNPAGLEGAGFPQINFNGNLTTLATPTSGGVKNNDKTYSFENNVTWTTGKHSFKFGGTFVKFKTFSGEVPNYGSASFTGIWTALNTAEIGPEHAYADFLLGAVRRSSRVSPRIDRVRDIKEIGLYATDSFKFSQKFTVDLGLRWDYYGLPTFKDGLMYNFDPVTGNVMIPSGARGEVDPRYPAATAANPNGIVIVEDEVVPKADRANFRPRIAAAYRFSDDFVLRGGYGAFTERISRFYTDLALGGGPFNKSGENFEAANATMLNLSNPFLSGNAGLSPLGAQSVAGFGLKNDDGVIHQFNVSLEKGLLGLGWRASYIGSRGTGLRAFVQLNSKPNSTPDVPASRAYPKFVKDGVSYLRDDFGSRYDAMQFEVRRRKGDFTFDAHYTYAVNKNNIRMSPNPLEPTSQWANDGSNRRHLAVVTSTWYIPVGRGRQFLGNAHWFVDTILGGWKLQTVSKFGSGFFVTPSIPVNETNADAIFYYGGTTVRPNQNGDPSLPRGERTLLNWYDPSVYSIPERGAYGNALANSIEGPGLHVHHASIAKTFTFKERYKLTFTSAFSNIFNTPNFCNPSGAVNSGGTIGCTTGNGGGSDENAGHRVGYLKLRFEF